MSTKNGTKEIDRLRERRQGKLSREVADWMAADATLLQRAVAAAGLKGGALRLGYTRDGGAYAIGIYGSGDPFTEFIRPSENINDYLQSLIDDLGAL